MCKVSVLSDGKTVEIDINDFDSAKHVLLGTSVLVKLVPVEIYNLNQGIYWYKNNLKQLLQGNVLDAVDPGEGVPVYQVDFPLNDVGLQWLPKKACSHARVIS